MSPHHRCTLTLLCVSLLAGCGDDTRSPAPDAAPPDSSSPDAAPPDSALPDSALPDADLTLLDADLTLPDADRCEYDLPCAPPSGTGGDIVCIGGRVVDAANWSLPPSPAELPDLDLTFHDALLFLTDPRTAQPSHTLRLDSCGRFQLRLSSSRFIPNGVLILTARGRAATPGAGRYALAGLAERVVAGQNQPHLRVPLLTLAQDQDWSSMAGLAGTTFAQTGAIAVRFHGAPTSPDDRMTGAPTVGLTPTLEGVVDATRDDFFETPEPLLSKLDATRSSTGKNGLALLRPPRAGQPNWLGNVRPRAGAGECQLPGGGTGTPQSSPSTLMGASTGALLFWQLEVTCN